MTVKPILFNTEMVRAILEGQKTATRRILQHGDWPVLNYGMYYCPGLKGSKVAAKLAKPGGLDSGGVVVSDYQPGDILYVREAWAAHPNGQEYLYKADSDTDGAFIRDRNGTLHSPRWRPSIHMPKEAARIFLRVTEVRAEGLQDITEEGAIKEGLYRGWRHTSQSTPAMTARQAFMWLWDSIVPSHSNKSYRWADNPWVWVIEFERCEQPKETAT